VSSGCYNTTEGTLAEGLARLFRDNMWKLHGLLESVILDRGPQFAVELMKELNKMLGIETRLSTAFYPQTDGQMEQINQELEQYLNVMERCGPNILFFIYFSFDFIFLFLFFFLLG